MNPSTDGDPIRNAKLRVARGQPLSPSGRCQRGARFKESPAPLRAGLFEVDAEGNTSGTFTLDEELPLQLDAFALTLEPAGGVPQPTSEPILVTD